MLKNHAGAPMERVSRFSETLALCSNEYGALLSAVNRNSGFTANKLMLGRGVNTPTDLLYPAP